MLQDIEPSGRPAAARRIRPGTGMKPGRRSFLPSEGDLESSGDGVIGAVVAENAVIGETEADAR